MTNVYALVIRAHWSFELGTAPNHPNLQGLAPQMHRAFHSFAGAGPVPVRTPNGKEIVSAYILIAYCS